MWFSAIKLALNAGTHIYKKRQETKMLMADAQATHASKMARGELEYKLVAAPVMLLIWSIFSDDPEIMIKVDRFFEYFNTMPFWYQALFIGVVSAIYGLKGADIIKRK